MNKPILLAGVGIISVCLLFFLGKTTGNKPQTQQKTEINFDIQSVISSEKSKLTSSQTNNLKDLEQVLKDANDSLKKIQALQNVAGFWKDSIHSFDPYIFYLSEAAKLDNSEKSLTFAAQLLLNNLRSEQDEAKLSWKSNEAIGLFERALKMNPDNDHLKIGLGSAYIFGKGRTGNSEATMKGVQELLAVTRKDPENMEAQMVLGIGGLMSGQYEKAVERFSKVIEKEPGNVEAIAYLADTYAAMGNRAEAVKWYSISKKLVNDPHYTEEVDARIKSLQ